MPNINQSPIPFDLSHDEYVILNASAQRRIIEQTKIRQLIRQSHFQEAIKKAKIILQENGEHISLFSNLCSCYYRLNNNIELKKTIKIFEQKFYQNQSILQTNTLFKYGMMLGKFLEEDARIAKAYAIYLEIEKKLNIDTDATKYFMLQAQLLRIEIHYNLSGPIHHRYLELTNLSESDLGLFDNIEIQHPILLYEKKHFGWNAISNKLNTLLNSDIDIYDKNLIYFDLIEEEFLEYESSKLTIPARLKTEDLYEQFLANPNLKVDLQWIQQIEANLSKSSLLKILTISLKKNRTNHIEFFQKKIECIMLSLDEPSKQIWIKKLKLEDPDWIQIHFDTENFVLSWEGKKLDLSRKFTAKNYLNVLVRHNNLDISKFAIEIGDNCFNEYTFNKLRVNIHRINKIWQLHSKLKKLICIEADKVLINPKYRITFN